MIKALLLLFDPTNTWEKITATPPSVVRVFFTYLLPLILLGSAVETWGLMKLGRDEGRYVERRVKVPEQLGVRYGASQVIAGIAIAFAGAWVFKMIAQGFHRRQSYAEAFAAQGYSLGPYYLARMLDGLPFLNTWICWGLGAFLVISLLYRAVPHVMKPDPSNALGVYLLCALVLVGILGIVHFLTVMVLDERILSHWRIPI